jgi:hypothetical protein
MDAAPPAASSSAAAAPPPSSPPGDGGLDPDPGLSLLAFAAPPPVPPAPAAPALAPPAPAAPAPAPAAPTPAAPGVPAVGVLEPPSVGMVASGARPEGSTMPSLLPPPPAEIPLGFTPQVLGPPSAAPAALDEELGWQQVRSRRRPQLN